MARKMMVILGVFDHVRDAEHAIAALKAMKISPSEISILAHPEAIPHGQRRAPYQVRNGTVVTTAGLVATLVGIGLCAIPLAGLLTAGPLMLAGGAASVVDRARPIDELRELGVHREDAQLAIENVRRGGIAIVVRVDRDMARRVCDVLARAGAVDFRRRGLEWERSGWVFEPNAPAYSTEQIASTRAQRGERMSAPPQFSYA